MPTLLSRNPAPGGPGIPPRWTRSDKDGVGTAYSSASRVWFTLSNGVINEVYYPTIDKPQVRDLQFLVTDGKTFFHDTRRHLQSVQEYVAPHTLGFRIVSTEPGKRYRLIKEIIADPHQPCVLIKTRLEGDPELLRQLHVYVLVAPHLGGSGWENTGNVVQTSYGQVLSAHKHDVWMTVGATAGLLRCSCGFVGRNDGWQDLADNFLLDHEYDSAELGNIALTAEINLKKGPEFILGLAFGTSLTSALVALAQGLGVSFDTQRSEYIDQWQHTGQHLLPELNRVTGDGGQLARISHSLILAHEDKIYDGALIASLSIPWGEVVGDDNLGGYHLVWTRDMYHSVTGLLAAGHTTTALRALIYLACTQRPDGGFCQNYWITGEPYWLGVQLDEVAFPIMLAWRLREMKALGNFDPYPMVIRAADFLIRFGPATAQERWEENSGYSPSTLAANIAGLLCAADFARDHGEEVTARYLEEYADYLESHIEQWTVTTQGTLVRDLPRHFIRIHPASPSDPIPDDDANNGMLTIRNRPPDSPQEFPAKDVIDGGFLELVRFGIRRGGDPLFEDSLRVMDATLKVDLPGGPCWKRYNHDGYGQRVDGSAFQGWGYGHAWPLLTGERGHYELAAGRDPRPYLQALEAFGTTSKLLAEQLWTLPDLPEAAMYFGKPTGGAMPLLWAHAEYLRLARSMLEGRVFDQLSVVTDRYLNGRKRPPLEVWKFSHQVQAMRPGQMLRIQARTPFRLHWTLDTWEDKQDTESQAVPALERHYVDITVPPGQRAPVLFTFFWPQPNRWEGKDYQVRMSGQ